MKYSLEWGLDRWPQFSTPRVMSPKFLHESLLSFRCYQGLSASGDHLCFPTQHFSNIALYLSLLSHQNVQFLVVWLGHHSVSSSQEGLYKGLMTSMALGYFQKGASFLDPNFLLFTSNLEVPAPQVSLVDSHEFSPACKREAFKTKWPKIPTLTAPFSSETH